MTTFVDGGSTGGIHFGGFRKLVLEASRAQVFAMINLCAVGQLTHGQGTEYNEFDLPDMALPGQFQSMPSFCRNARHTGTPL